MVQEDPAIALVVAAAVHQLYEERASLLSGQLAGLEHMAAVDWVVVAGGHQTKAIVELIDKGYFVSLDELGDYQVETNWSLGEPIFMATINGKQVSVQVEAKDGYYRLFYRGAEISAQLLSPKAAELSTHMHFKEPEDMSKFLLSPMPGLLVKLAVELGQEVKEGEELAVVEAMKMENSLRAIQDGIVTKISAVEGESLRVDEIILEFS